MGKSVGSVEKVLKNSTIYVIGNLALKAFNIIVIPVYTHFLSTREYGQVSILNNFTNVMIYIVGMSLYSAVMRFYTDYKDDKRKTTQYFSTIVWFVFFSGVLFSVLLVTSRGLLQKFIFGEIVFNPTILLCVVSLIFCCAYTMYQSILRSLEKASKYIVISSLYLLLNFLSLYIFVVRLQMGVPGVMIAQLSAYSISTVIMIIDLVMTGYLRLEFKISMLIESLKYSIPLIPHNLSAQITQLVSKVFIQTNRSYSELGVFNLASQFGMISDLVQNSVSMAIQPWFYSLLKTREAGWKRELNLLIRIVLVSYFFVFAGLCVFSQEVIYIAASEAYYAAWKVIPYIVLTYVIKVPYYFYINTLFYYKKAAKFIFTATLTSSLINAFLSYFFISWWGMYGSIYADAVAMIIRVAIVIYLSVKIENIGIEFIAFIKVLILTAIMGIIGSGISLLFAESDQSLLRIIVKIVVFLVGNMVCLWSYNIHIMDLLNKIMTLKKGKRNG